jgi:subtilase family serine protease
VWNDNNNAGDGFNLGYVVEYEVNPFAPSDLVVSSLTHSPASPTTADTITFTAVVKNIGTATAPASTLMFKIGGETPGAPETLFAVPALAPGETFQVQRQATLIAQNYINTATADYTGSVPETNETNNTTTDSYTVSPGLAPDVLSAAMAWPLLGNTGGTQH